ncbi:MAG: hypothetical protein IPI30_18795 [Saprospiraceae bacterium]|nr:hypothetical protein [Candidatus Vicinibacter affinis]
MYLEIAERKKENVLSMLLMYELIFTSRISTVCDNCCSEEEMTMLELMQVEEKTYQRTTNKMSRMYTTAFLRPVKQNDLSKYISIHSKLMDPELVFYFFQNRRDLTPDFYLPFDDGIGICVLIQPLGGSIQQIQIALLLALNSIFGVWNFSFYPTHGCFRICIDRVWVCLIF